MAGIKAILMLALFATSVAASAKIDYTVPDGFVGRISAVDYRYILERSLKRVAESDKIKKVEQGEIQLADGKIVNMHNLLHRCIAADKKEWNGLIDEHFKRLASIYKSPVDATNYQKIKKFLGYRVYPREAIDRYKAAGKMVIRKDLAGTYTVLMLDLPTTWASITRDNFKKWKISKSEAFKQADRNMSRKSLKVGSEPVKIKPDIDFKFSYVEDNDYAASFAIGGLRSGAIKPAAWGLVIAIPNNGFATWVKVSREKPVDFILFIQVFDKAIKKAFNENEKGISPEFYWYYKNKFTPIRTFYKNERLNVINPEGLSELMSEQK